MRILVTGGAGFIGSSVVQRALDHGHEVAVLDDLSTGSRANVPAGAELHIADLQEYDVVRELVARFRPEVVNHQAAQASVAVSVRDPLHDAGINIMGTLHLLEACRHAGVGRIVFASSGGTIYGDVPAGERAAETWEARPESPYATSKLVGESYLRTYHLQYGLEYTVLRYGNVYGPRQSPHGEAGAVAIFCEQILAGQGLTVYGMHEPGDGGCVRDYVYVSDVARANLAASLGQLPTRVLNVGTGQPTTTADLATQVQRALGRTVPVHDRPPRAGDVPRSLLDSSQFSTYLGGHVPLEDGLKQTVDWFAAQLQQRF